MSLIGATMSGVLLAAISAMIGKAIISGMATDIPVEHLSVENVVEKLEEYKHIKQEDNDNRIGFMLKEKLKESGHYRVVVGIWDKKTEEIKAATIYDAKILDSSLQDAEALVIYP